jgi:hypothetical protein
MSLLSRLLLKASLISPCHPAHAKPRHRPGKISCRRESQQPAGPSQKGECPEKAHRHRHPAQMVPHPPGRIDRVHDVGSFGQRNGAIAAASIGLHGFAILANNLWWTVRILGFAPIEAVRNACQHRVRAGGAHKAVFFTHRRTCPAAIGTSQRGGERIARGLAGIDRHGAPLLTKRERGQRLKTCPVCLSSANAHLLAGDRLL